MKKMYISFVAILFAMATTLFLSTGCLDRINTATAEDNDQNSPDPDRYDGPDKAAQFEWERTHDLSTGKVPSDKLLAAILQTESMKSQYRPDQATLLSWLERGPNGDFAGPFGNGRQNNDQTGGRTRAAMVDSLDATHKTVWVGGVDGGLWKTTDITASPATWILINDFLSNLAVSAISQDPRPGFQNIMYFCTGESFSNADGVRGVGVFKSIDAGATWNYLPSTSSYVNCSRILCDYQGNIYLGTRNTGLLRSTNGGTTWTTITPAALGGSICDLEISSTSGPARLHVASGIFSTSGYSYTDIPATVTSGSGWNAPTTPFTTFNQRTEMAISGSVLYACPCNGNYQVPTIWKSTDGGDNWVAVASQPSASWASGQGWYSLSCAINPTNSNECIVGGLDTWKTSNSGASWIHLSGWVTGLGVNQYVHADQHNIQWWDGGNKLLFTNDGGAFYTSDGGTTIRDRNKGLRLKQFYSIAIHPTETNTFLAGAQDNGMHRLNHPGLDSSLEVVGGDGCYSAIDQLQGQYEYGSYVYNVFRRTANNGATWSTPVNLGTSGSNGRFVNPWDYDNIGKNVYACYTANNYMRWDNAQTSGTTTIVPMAAFNGGNVSAVTVSPFTANRVYFGMGTGGIVQVDNANGASPTGTIINTGSGMPAGYVNCIVTGLSDQNMIATFTNYGVQNVWVTYNGGTSWTAIDGNLPDMPVRWALFYPEDNTKAYIATETGVWETDLINGGSTVWNPDVSFPTVRTDMIKYRASDRTIAAGTHGRGIWSSTVPAPGCTAASISSQPSDVTTCAGNNASFSVTGGGSGPLSYQWQASTGGCAGPWNNISNGGIYSGATTATLSITGVILGTYGYRCVITGNCAPLTVTSNCATLTVNAVTNITSQPANSTLCAGGNTSFSVSATGSSLGYQWQESTNGGGTWNNITNGGIYGGATTTTLTLTGVTAGMNGYLYRAVVNSACSPLNSNNATLTVNAPPAISSQPANSSLCAGNTATFNVTATGGSLTYQWQESINGGGTWNNLSNIAPYSGVTTATLSISPTTLTMNGYMYRCIISGICGAPATSSGATLTVGTTLIITSQPSGSTVCAGTNTSFAVSVTGTVISYQWQESINGGANWNNISNGGIYSGATSATLTLTGILGSMNNYQYRCVVTGSCPAINSNVAILTVNTAPNISSQPSASTVCATQNTSFTVAASGTAVTYQWQVSTTGCAGAFVNLVNGAPYSGVTTATLAITNATAAMNGYAYRVVVSGTCAPAATSSCVILTVNTAVTITSQPANSTVCAGATTSFNVAASGTTPGYQWQESTNGGGTWNNISNGGVYGGATISTLTLTGVTAGMNGYLYRCIISGAAPCGTLNSGNGTLTVNTAPAITAQPVANSTICAGQATTYTVGANGTALVYQWQVSTDGGATFSNITNGGVYSGATTSTLIITGATVAMNGYQYHVVIGGTCAPSATSANSSLTVYTAIAITTQPANTTICSTGTTSLSVAAAGTSPSYQWQLSTDGGTTWNNISNGGVYSNATTATLTLTAITVSMNGYKYRCAVTGLAPCGAINTAAIALTVSAQPTVILTPFPYTHLFPGYTTTLTASSSISPTSNAVYVWFKNNTLLTGVIGTTYVVDVNHLGDYKVTVTDISNSCTNTSAVVTIADSASNKLWIYPSPTPDGQFTISYYNPGGSATTQDISIYNSLGERVYVYKDFPVSQAYQLLKVDMRRNAAGVYHVILSLKDGTKKTGTVEVR